MFLPISIIHIELKSVVELFKNVIGRCVVRLFVYLCVYVYV